MSVTRWQVRECPTHGLTGRTRCADCHRDLGEPFEVVTAQAHRSSDPDTSKLAAFRVQPKITSQRGKVLAVIEGATYHGLTAREAAVSAGVDGGWKRVSELAQGGHVVVTARRACRQTGHDAEVFVAKAYAPAESLF